MEDINSGLEERRLLDSIWRDALKFPMLSREEEREIAKQYMEGDEEALKRLVGANIRFVIKLAFEYWRPGLPLMDMISEGCIGLMEAAKRFDPDLGYRLLTYASKAIEWRIMAVINDCVKHKHISLDIPIYDEDEETTLKDMLISEETSSDEECFYREVSHFLSGLIHRLNDREQKVIRLRFWHDLTLDYVGVRMGLSGTRVGQVEARALRKIRSGFRAVKIDAGSFVNSSTIKKA